jgi:hypothetical protein
VSVRVFVIKDSAQRETESLKSSERLKALWMGGWVILVCVCDGLVVGVGVGVAPCGGECG